MRNLCLSPHLSHIFSTDIVQSYPYSRFCEEFSFFTVRSLLIFPVMSTVSDAK